MLQVDTYYFYGITVDRSKKEASYWLKKVSEFSCQNSPIVNKFIARMYYSGSMPRKKQSYEKSYVYHLKSAKDDLYSAGQIAFMQSIGNGCQYDYANTEKFFCQ